MAHIVPSIAFLMDIKSGIEQGVSVNESILRVLNRQKDEFGLQMALWWSYEKNAIGNQIVFKTQYQKSLAEILHNGLQGAPIYEQLQLLEKEMSEEFERQWRGHLEALPMKLSLPLLVFFFPAYIVLMFGPLIIQLLNEVQ